MKITVNIDCTPMEARVFLGLPDIKPLQDAFMAEMQAKITSGLSDEDIEKVFNLWLSPGLGTGGLNLAGKNMEAFQDIFWNVAKSSDK